MPAASQNGLPSAASRLRALRAEVEAEAALLLDRSRKKLLPFTVFTMSRYQVSWHHLVVARALDRFIHLKTKRLMVFMPPRHGKSELVSRRLPALIFGYDPLAKVIATSYSADLAARNNRDVQRVIDTPEYRQLFPLVTLNGENSRAGRSGNWLRNSDIFEIVNYGGVYRSSGVGGGITGMGATHILIDDPIKNQEEATSLTYRNRLWDWYTTTLYTRLEKDGGICLCMTRWHEDDLAGRLLAQAAANPQTDQWEVISFPAVAEGGHPDDPRLIGEALWPEKYNLARLGAMQETIGSQVWNALYQQRPAPEAGMIVKREWWRFYDKPPAHFDSVVQSWDLTFTGSKTSDFVVGLVLGRKGADIYVLDMARGRMSFTDSVAAIKNLSRKWPNASAKYVERAANGYAAIETLQHEIPGLIGVKPMGSKVARANAAAPRIEAGNLWLPNPALGATWVNALLDEWATFPASANDDIVDALTQGILKLSEQAPTDWLPVGIAGTNYWR